MKKITMFVVLATFTVLFSSFKTIEKSKNSPLEDLNRQVLNTIEFVEECEEVDLGFDTPEPDGGSPAPSDGGSDTPPPGGGVDDDDDSEDF